MQSDMSADPEINVYDTIRLILLQRYGCFPSFNHYFLCVNAILVFAINHNLLEQNAIKDILGQ